MNDSSISTSLRDPGVKRLHEITERLLGSAMAVMPVPQPNRYYLHVYDHQAGRIRVFLVDERTGKTTEETTHE